MKTTMKLKGEETTTIDNNKNLKLTEIKTKCHNSTQQ